jgi:F-type H+-transporting ATPase subunit gamma
VSASKLKRAQDYAARSRAYRELAYELLARLSAIKEVEQHALFTRRPVKRRLYIIITSSSGLAGAYNANILKQLTRNITQDRADKVVSHVIAVGSKGAQFVRRLQDVELTAVYPSFGDQPSAGDVQPILASIIEQYETGATDEVSVLYTMSKSSISQVVQSLPLLPADITAQGEDNKDGKTLPTVSNFEPDTETVIENVATRLIEAQIWQAVLEGLASEHAMRMIAMKNATDNANELIDDYTLEYNTARQAAITQELAEITGGAEALNG